jgi:hypothetical protein
MTRSTYRVRASSPAPFRGRTEIRKSNFRWGGFQRVGRPLPPCVRNLSLSERGNRKARD